MKCLCRAGLITALIADIGLLMIVLGMLVVSGGADFIVTSTSVFGMAEYVMDVAGVGSVLALNVLSLICIVRRKKRCQKY